MDKIFWKITAIIFITLFVAETLFIAFGVHLVNKSKYNEYMRKYREDNKKKMLEYAKKYREEHREKFKEYAKKYYQKKKNSIQMKGGKS